MGNRRSEVGEIDGINRKLDVGSVPFRIAGKSEDLDGVNAQFIDFVPEDPEAWIAPIGIGALHRKAARQSGLTDSFPDFLEGQVGNQSRIEAVSAEEILQVVEYCGVKR
jgi:hypothetical protein